MKRPQREMSKNKIPLNDLPHTVLCASTLKDSNVFGIL